MFNFLLNHTPLLYWTQSLWRDEAFSVWIAKDSLAEVIRRTSGDFNPPLYYICLNLWMKLFGQSEIPLRGFSIFVFFWFLLVVYMFGKKIFKASRPAAFTTLLMAVNPMLLYFAFELRMYSLLMLLATLSMYFFYQKRWRLYVLFTVLGLYTQPFMVFVILAQDVLLVLTKQGKRALTNAFYLGLCYLPWLPVLINQFRASGPMWIFPVDTNLVLSVLGNLLLGYEGTPPHLWPFMKVLSYIFIATTICLWRIKSLRKKSLLFIFWVFVPLAIVLGASYIKPLYVHRYLIFVTVGEVFILSLYTTSIRSPKVVAMVFTTLILVSAAANFWFAPYHTKVNIRQSFLNLNSVLDADDVIFAETPLVYYESVYYAPPDKRVYLYNPDGLTPPRFVGLVGMPEEVWAATFPVYPKRAFLIHENGTYSIMSVLYD